MWYNSTTMNIHECRYCKRKTFITFIKSRFCYFCTGNLPFKKRFSIYKCQFCSSEMASNRVRKFCDVCADIPKSNQVDKWYFFKSKNKFTCKKCNSYVPKTNTRWRLHVHHKIPRECGGLDNEDNLICLCSGCHAHVHRYPEKYPEFINIPDGVKWKKIWNIIKTR